jgi:uncharacterized protein (DUF58 family)
VLVVEDDNTERLGTESRYAIGPGARKSTVTVAGRLRATPRGLHRLGPARISYQDALGLTRVGVASVAVADLLVLPRFVPLEIVEPPRSRLQSPDVVARPHRFATDDPFRFREYVTGDDTRRIVWRMSIRTGRLHVRVPETRETATKAIVLALDSWLAPGTALRSSAAIHDVLDRLVETWISLARELRERGNSVSLVAVADSPDGERRIERLAEQDLRLWQDLGARASWQGSFDLDALVAHVGPETELVVVSSRIDPPPAALHGSLTWVYRAPLDALGTRSPGLLRALTGDGPGSGLRILDAIFRLPAPSASDDSTLWRQLRGVLRLRRSLAARRRLRLLAARRGESAWRAIAARGEPVYILEPGPIRHRLVGVSARAREVA